MIYDVYDISNSYFVLKILFFVTCPCNIVYEEKLCVVQSSGCAATNSWLMLKKVVECFMPWFNGWNTNKAWQCYAWTDNSVL